MTNAARTTKAVDDLRIPTSCSAVTKIVRPNGAEVFEVIGWVYGLNKFPCKDGSKGINIKLRSKHKSPTVWWEIKVFGQGLVAVVGQGTVDGIKVKPRKTLSQGDTIRVTAPVKYESEIRRGDNSVIKTRDGSASIARFNWIVNYFSQIKLLRRAEKPNLESVPGVGESKGPESTEPPVPDSF